VQIFITHLPRQEIKLDTVLEAFPFDLHGSDDKGIAQEMTRVSNTLSCPETERGSHTHSIPHNNIKQATTVVTQLWAVETY
jgi:hypothetical protein